MTRSNGKKASVSPVVQQITTALGETKPMARGQIKRIVQTIEEERALAILQQALEIEQHGGLMLPDGKRRTPGGVFFRLVKEQMTPEERRQVWFYQGGAKAAQHTKQSATG
ncbi:MAG TPA: phosphorylated adapter RNA export RNA-binding domain-containing protein [Rubrobacter sp.]|nr:phosphorylated adapter RNA export RNA-binding domain-containing protein [Rubrobacter sp.]